MLRTDVSFVRLASYLVSPRLAQLAVFPVTDAVFTLNAHTLVLRYLLVLFSSCTLATEGGGSNYLPGFYGDFAMAVMPAAGTYFTNFMTAYQDKTSKTGTLIELPSIVQVTGYQVLGGYYSAGIYPGIAITKDHGGSHHQDRLGAADAYLMPVAIYWQWSNLTALFYEGIIAPTGNYQKNGLSTGRNIWTFDHILSLSWQLPGDNELSTTLGYMNNLKNQATGYGSGDELHFDYNFGHYFSPSLGLGVAGSYYRQVTADHAPADILTTTLSEASSIGPVLMLTPYWLERDVTFSLKWLHEYNVQGRMAQDYLVCRVVFAF